MIDEETLRDALVEGIAECAAVTVDEAEAAIAAAGGDFLFELDSRQAEWVIARVEYLLKLVTPLPKPADLPRNQFATLGALGTAIAGALEGRQ
ncbi:hypothetical protein [Nocardia aurantia]|uniref:Uncharacterized protein n=1 Tax=Nocardia aurantia TaxID=2585199 RepID=A0A7K0DND3_9NOCA|nr:hypothetical protein [Nocardia aurantia]MQY27240.1 hypothetical protein [Nocardia aurantia]